MAAGALILVAAAVATAQDPVRRADVPHGYGLDLAAAKPLMRRTGDVTFEGDSVQARGGIAPLPGSEATYEPEVTTSRTAAALSAGAGYLVNDRRGRTWVVHVVAIDSSRVSVTVAPSAATLHLRAPAPSTSAGSPPRSP